MMDSDKYVTNVMTSVSIVGAIGLHLDLGRFAIYAMMGTFAAVSIITLILELRTKT